MDVKDIAKLGKMLAQFLARFATCFASIAGGMACGATLTDYDFAPWRMPDSLHSPNPHPLITLWSGPMLGVAIPVGIASVARRRWMWFIADFCIIANGTYLALAWISGDRFLDTTRMLAAGANPVTIVVYCVLTIGLGYAWFRSDCAHYLLPAPELRERK